MLCSCKFSQEIVEDADHISLLYPKLYCGLNCIEHYWSSCKHFARKHCTYTLAGKLRLGVRMGQGTDC